MNELNNYVTSEGNYNGIPTSLTSNVSVVNIIDGLTIKKEADKQNWGNGDLTYTITIENNAEKAYETPVVTDVIDTTLVKLIENSITINGTPAEGSQYNYDTTSHTLKVTLDNVEPNDTATLTFRVEKNS